MKKFVVEILGIPNAGKSTLVSALRRMLNDEGLSVLVLDNKNFALRQLKAQSSRLSGYSPQGGRIAPRVLNERSEVHQKILTILDQKTDASRDVILFEHGFYGTMAMECYGMRYGKQKFTENTLEVRSPDMVFWLYIDPEIYYGELCRRGVSPVVSDRRLMSRIHQGLLELRAEHGDYWISIDATARPEIIAEVCLEHILDRRKGAWRPQSRFFQRK